MQRPTTETVEGQLPAPGNREARQFFDAPISDSVLGKRGRALLSTLPFHALRRH